MIAIVIRVMMVDTMYFKMDNGSQPLKIGSLVVLLPISHSDWRVLNMGGFSFIVGPGPKLPDGYIIKEYVKDMKPRVQARGHVSMRTQLSDGVSFLFHIKGFENLGQEEFFCSLRDTHPLYPLIQDGAMIELDGVYNGITLNDIQPIHKGGI